VSGQSLLQLHSARQSAWSLSDSSDDEDTEDRAVLDTYEKDFAQDANNPLDADYVPGETELAEAHPQTPGSAESPESPESPKSPTSTTTEFHVDLARRARVFHICATWNDIRANSLSYTTAPEGTPCKFGLDARDEGSHCIFDNGKYGSNGWCFTSDDFEWGSCNEHCPLYGANAALSKQLQKTNEKLDKLVERVGRTAGDAKHPVSENPIAQEPPAKPPATPPATPPASPPPASTPGHGGGTDDEGKKKKAPDEEVTKVTVAPSEVPVEAKKAKAEDSSKHKTEHHPIAHESAQHPTAPTPSETKAEKQADAPAHKAEHTSDDAKKAGSVSAAGHGGGHGEDKKAEHVAEHGKKSLIGALQGMHHESKLAELLARAR
jgi:hypothetical protein